MIDDQPTIVDRNCITRTYELARAAVARGNHPFGALLSYQGRILDEYANEVMTSKDITRHAECGLVSRASASMAPAVLARATLYTSTEPCIMCCGAIHWAGIARIVFGVRAVKMMEAIDEPYRGFPSREIFARINPEVSIRGPFLEEEGFTIHQEYWPTHSGTDR